MAEPVTIEEMDRIKADNRHKEMMAAMKQLSASIATNQNTGVIDEIVTKNNEALQVFISRVESLSQAELPSPQVSIETNQDKVVSSVLEMSKSVSQNLLDLKAILDTRPTEWEFVVTSWEKKEGIMRISKLKATAINGK